MLKEINGDIIQWLRGFYHVALSGSITKGAAAMGRDRASVFHQVGKLENMLGATLFVRSKQGMKLTGEGQKMLRWTEELFLKLETLNSGLFDETPETLGRLHIGMTHLMAVRIVVPAMDEYFKLYPKVEVELFIAPHLQFVAMVETGELDFAVGLRPPVSSATAFEPLLRDTPMLAASKKAGILKGTPSSLADLAQYQLLTVKKFSSYFNILFGNSNPFSTKLVLRASANDEYVLLEMLKRGYGTAVLPRLMVEEAADELEWYPLTNVTSSEPAFGIITRKNTTPPAYVEDFFRKIRQVCQYLPGSLTHP